MLQFQDLPVLLVLEVHPKSVLLDLPVSTALSPLGQTTDLAASDAIEVPSSEHAELLDNLALEHLIVLLLTRHDLATPISAEFNWLDEVTMHGALGLDLVMFVTSFPVKDLISMFLFSMNKPFSIIKKINLERPLTILVMLLFALCLRPTTQKILSPWQLIDATI
jgi:hypothetical protein